MQQRKWSGNVRELENFIERLVTLALPDMAALNSKILPAEFQKEFKKFTPSSAEHSLHKSLQESLDEVEEQLIRQTLMKNGWNQSKAARALKISERALRYKMEKLGIARGEG
jgi:DNA-binding NtrC family response regulator